MKIILFAILAITLITSCTENKNASLIIGKWQAISWLSKDKAINNNNVTFRFDDKAGYIYENDGVIEKGTYKVDNNGLYTTAEKQQEIMVNITKLTTDSLTFEMNRGGQAETLVLVKQK
jgi:hypothetical protein